MFCCQLQRCYDALMRTTVTLDPDVETLLRRRMRERRLGFKQALNEALRAGLAADAPGSSPPTPSFELGEPLVPLDKALQLAAELEDTELARRLAVRK
jgi:hypothetical protein